MGGFHTMLPAVMPIKNNEGRTIGEGVIDMHGLLRVTLDDSEEATEFLQFDSLHDRYSLKFNLMLGFEPAEPYVKGQLRSNGS